MKKSRRVAIVQSRLGSTRLPLKAFLMLHGHALIDWVLMRLKMAESLDGIIVAVPDTELDSLLLKHLQEQGVECMAGPEDDVLERFLLAAKKSEAGEIVRVCADNPLIWGGAVDRLAEFYEKGNCDYAYNHVPRGNLWPDGLGAEIISRELLEEIGQKAQKQSQREHCLNYIWDNPAKYRIATFNPQEEGLRRPDLKLDVDTPEDFLRLASKPIKPGMGATELVALWPR